MKGRYQYLLSVLLFLLMGQLFAQQFQVPLTVTDGPNSQILTIGVDPNGTDAFDTGLDQFAPPEGPPGTFNAALVLGLERFFTDIRDNSLTQKIFTTAYTASAGNGPIVFTWDPASLASLGTFTIVDNFTGTLFSLDMTTAGSLDVSTSPFLASGFTIQVTPSQPTGPTADFSGTPLSGFAPLAVNFTDASLPGGSAIASYAWDFGDGNTSTEQNPTHVYNTAGTYTVSLTVTDGDGNSAAETKTDYVTVDQAVAPIADFSGTPTSGLAPLTVNFSDLSTAGSGTITSYAWDFGDGGSSTEQNPSYTYNAAGTYTVSLTVTDDLGNSGTESKTAYITVDAVVNPTADFSGTPTSGLAPLTVNFSDLSTAGSGTITSYAWDFGDGGSSTEQNPSYTYNAAGTYTVSLTVTDDLGNSGTESKTAYITVDAVVNPTADFSGTPTSGLAPLTVNFSDLSTAGSGTITSYAWDFGDGGSSTEQNPSYTYNAAGTYAVSLTVTDDLGNSGTESKTAYITVDAAVPDIAVSATSLDFGDVILGNSSANSVTVSNTGNGDLTVTTTVLSGSDAGDFSIVSGGAPFTLAPGASQEVSLEFSPSATGAKSASLVISSDDPDENPVSVALSGNGTAVPVPDIAVSATSLDFGDVTVGNSASQSVTVSNEGSADLNVSATTLSGANAAEFAIVSGGGTFTLAPGASQVIELSFSPASVGSKTASLEISSDDPDENPVSVALSGNGTAVPVPDIAVSATSLDFGDVTVGNSASQSVTVSNEGSADLNVSATALSGANAAEFAIVSGGGTFTLAPGASQVIELSFSPASVGSKTASLEISSDDPDENPVSVALSGNGTAVPVPDIAVSATSLDFGDVTVGSSASQSVTVSNEGSTDLNVSATTLSGANAAEFAIVSGGGTFTLAPGASQVIELSFSPASVGSKTASLEISSDDPDENPVSVALSGNGTAVPVPDIAVSATSLDFGDVTVGNSASQSVTVSNEGSADLNVSATALSGANAAEFAIVSGGGTFTLAPGASQVIELSFSPASVGSKTASLEISSDDPDENPVSVALSGNGTAVPVPDIAVSATSLDFGDVTVGNSASQSVTVSNEGSADLNVSATALSGANAAEFAIVSGGGTFTLAPGASQVIELSFSPASVGGKTASLEISSDDPDENPVSVALSGNGIAVPVPDIAVSATSLDFGDVTVGSSASQSVTVSNEGSADLNVSATALSDANAAEFAIVSGGGTFTLAPGASQVIELSFSPASVGGKTASLEISSDDPDENPVSVVLSGNGTAVPVPDIAVSATSLDFGDVTVGSSASQSVTVSNEGSADLNVSATALSGANAAEFAIVSGGGTFTLAPGASQVIELSFSPASVGSKSASLDISSDDPDENPVSVALSGNATEANVAPVVAAIDDQSMDAGSSLTVAVSASDANGDALTLSVQNLPDFASFTDNGDGTGEITFNPALDENGTYSDITVTATDDGDPALSGSESFSLIVNSVVVDNTDPSCRIAALLPGPPVTIEVLIHDSESGLADIQVIRADNATVNIPSFTPGTNDTLLITAQKVEAGRRSVVVLEVTDVAGNSVQCDPVYQTVSAVVPDGFALHQNYPNPFNPNTIIRFDVAQMKDAGAVEVSLKVFDVTGREVRTLISDALSAGQYAIEWDGYNDRGEAVAGGIYLYRLQVGDFAQTRKMIYVK